MKPFDADNEVLTNAGIEEKIAVQARIDMRVAGRIFLEQSLKLASTLPSRKKCLFYMRFDNGFSIKEIAEVCRTDEATVSKRLRQIVNEINRMRRCCREEKHGHKNK